ncbi:Crp/Fnr family transcriptional regulator [Autumnicola psychrophila]|uniref:Crp/Fnr family transcriptional regulator n=1 Tax=Autumnicola psychrophila TaxID=3075592 RepID=A0ABU3DQJ0_9FLAO|nr:Crp/Fnr family transcriptional regulator [Zunongwangia sp. F225]MDT0685888.1 Crp/Fnr family transcriptional regulator [Zunongwangia sp. F225]
MMIERPVLPNNSYKNLDRFNLFEYLSSKYLLEKNITTIEMGPNKYIYRPPENPDFYYEIISGAIKLGSYTQTGEEFVHDIIWTGDYFGNLKYLNGQFFEFSKTLVATKIRCYDLNVFKSIIVEDGKISEWFISYLVSRWCRSEKKNSIIKEKDPKNKIKFLRSYFNSTIYDSNNVKSVLYELLTQKDLGDFAGLSRQSIALAQNKY